MKLSISNIAWTENNDDEMYHIMRDMGFTGLEIAPTRIIPEKPYDKADEAGEWARNIKERYGFEVSSMQSIWFGIKENLFGTENEREFLVEYTKKAICFAEIIGCNNLVFGCPRNRNFPEGADDKIAVSFFRELGDYAAKHHTVIGMEANPAIYNTNYINGTWSAIKLIDEVASEGFKLNLDIGAMIENKEEVSGLKGNEHYINHVHISEPGLNLLEERQIHKDIMRVLHNCSFSGYISIEIGRQNDLDILRNSMNYIKRMWEETQC